MDMSRKSDVTPAPHVSPKRSRPDLREEQHLWQAGFACVAGIDEVGRGALAGPVVAAAVVLPSQSQLPAEMWTVDDSKQVPPRRRQRLSTLIQEVSVTTATGLVSAAEIDRVGIVAATRQAMVQAVTEIWQAGFAVDYLLIDFLTLDLPLPQQGIVRGDSHSLSIAAASIVAKVTRDRWMDELATVFPAYGFEQHKGYATAAHRQALDRYGPCAEHRRSFSPVSQLSLPLGNTGV
jgi:ribonuclease HII